MGFVKASELLGVNTSASSSGRNTSLESFPPTSKHFPADTANISSKNESTAARDTVVSSEKTTLRVETGFCQASVLLPNHNSVKVVATREREGLEVEKESSTPLSSSSKSVSQLALPGSTSEQDLVVIDLRDLTSEESKTISARKESSKTKTSSRKAKIDPAVVKTRKITYFFEK